MAAIAATSAFAGASVSYGLQDDAWIQFGPGTVEERIATLQQLGIRVVRLTVRWDQVEPDEGTIRLGAIRRRPRAAPGPRASIPS